MRKSKKIDVIEYIYNSLLDPISGALSRSIVTKVDVREGILKTGANLSSDNLANFIKDFIRGSNASKNWPQVLKDKRVTARQVTGDGNICEFIPYGPDQTEPFPSAFGYHEHIQRYRVQSVTVPLATKEFGRNDETYLTQVAVKLGIVETHLALASPLRVIEVSHLQMGIKLRRTEIDSMYSATRLGEHEESEVIIVTVEAKKFGQRILVEQIIQQVRAAFTVAGVDFVVPIAMTGAPGGIYVAEFFGVHRDEAEKLEMLQLNSEMLYELEPPVIGIWPTRRPSKRKVKAKNSHSSS